ncbi:MAG: putative transposase, partial [Paraburkholderia sp.]|nr:putative transposase [Paraburkholderia sp.]
YFLKLLLTAVRIKRRQPVCKADMQSIWMAATRAEAHAAFNRFVSSYAAKYPKATETSKKDQDSLLAFYDFAACIAARRLRLSAGQ